jgi:hypothetical protein
MGKRELLIIAGFAAAGTLLYFLLAPPPEPATGEAPDNLTEILIDRNRPAAPVTATTTGTFALPADLDEIRLADIDRLEVRGEDRRDVAWSLTAQAAAPDEATAQAAVDAVSVRHDQVGRMIAIGVRRPEEAIRAATLGLGVPSAARLRLESARESVIEGVAAVRLENLAGNVSLRNVAGRVEGSQRNGSLTVEGAGQVVLTLAETAATLRDVAGEVSIHARDGATTIERSHGVTAVETVDQRLAIVGAAGPIRGSARGGTVTIERPRAVVDFDVRRVELDIQLDTAVPVMLFARNSTVTLTLPASGDVVLDIVAEDGTIDATAIGLVPDDADGEQTLLTGTSGPRLAIRMQESAIVIRPAK